MKKETLFFFAFAIVLLGSLFLFLKAIDKPEPPIISIKARYELNVLAKKYDIPLETAYRLFRQIDRVRDAKGVSDWGASIEKMSKETGISEQVIASFLLDMKLCYQFSGDYSDPPND